MIELYAHEKMDFFDKKDDPFQNYLITNFGRVYSLKSRKFLKLQPNNCGYLRVDVRYFNKDRKSDKFRKQIFIHIEVVKVFGDCLGRNFKKANKEIDTLNIDHINKNKSDVRQCNLQIVSFQENMHRRYLNEEERKEYLKQQYDDINIDDIF